MPFDNTDFPPAPVKPVKYAKEIIVLDKMLALLDRPKGWVKGTYETVAGGHCLIGAMFEATGVVVADAAFNARSINGHTSPLVERLANLADVSARGTSALEAWNDRSRRCKREVLDLIKEARESFMAEA